MQVATFKFSLAKMCSEVLFSFRQYCILSKPLPVEIHLKLYDITNGAGKFGQCYFYLFPCLHYKLLNICL